MQLFMVFKNSVFTQNCNVKEKLDVNLEEKKKMFFKVKLVLHSDHQVCKQPLSKKYWTLNLQ